MHLNIRWRLVCREFGWSRKPQSQDRWSNWGHRRGQLFYRPLSFYRLLLWKFSFDLQKFWFLQDSRLCHWWFGGDCRFSYCFERFGVAHLRKQWPKEFGLGRYQSSEILMERLARWLLRKYYWLPLKKFWRTMSRWYRFWMRLHLSEHHKDKESEWLCKWAKSHFLCLWRSQQLWEKIDCTL